MAFKTFRLAIAALVLTVFITACQNDRISRALSPETGEFYSSDALSSTRSGHSEEERKLQADFDAFCTELFRKEMESSGTLDLHYTLLHPENYGIDAEDAALGTYRLSELIKNSREIHDLKEKLSEFDLPLSLDEIKAVWTRMSIDKYRHEVPLKPGVLEFLKYCKENGIRTGIGTSNGSEIVDAVLTSLKVKEYFDAVVTACEVAHGKPEPDIYLEVAKRLGVQPENCLVFEDIPAGIMAGKAAGMPVIAMEDDFSADLMDEKRELADAVISDYRELL